jgi:S1-C subfamily serine protease
MPTRHDSSGNIVLGDIIVAIQGQSIRTSDDLDNVLERFNVGDEVRVEIIRGGRRRTLSVRLQEA